MSRNLESMISTHDNDIDCNDDDNDAESGSEEEELDPRVQEELEKLNKHTDQINKLEIGLEEANGLFRTLLSDSTHQLKAMSQKVGMFTLYFSFFCKKLEVRTHVTIDKAKKFPDTL